MTPFVEQPYIPSIPNDRGIERFGQIQKILFQRTFLTGTTRNTISNPNAAATYTPLCVAEDGSKISVSPFIMQPENEPGEAREYGGGNATLNGIPILLGREASPFSCRFKEIKQHVMAEVRKLTGETLSVYLINEHGQIGCIKDGAEYRGIPIRQFFLADKRFGNYEEVDSNDMRFFFVPGWSDHFVIIDPEDGFDPLHDLENPSDDS